ncbi:hypothetical protein BD309DRAFT_980197 [Dichomitus squalens]|nr:hypothetical protein BD309DRAFT_980197 [Dichomitus squalens]
MMIIRFNVLSTRLLLCQLITACKNFNMVSRTPGEEIFDKLSDGNFISYAHRPNYRSPVCHKHHTGYDARGLWTFTPDLGHIQRINKALENGETYTAMPVRVLVFHWLGGSGTEDYQIGHYRHACSKAILPDKEIEIPQGITITLKPSQVHPFVDVKTLVAETHIELQLTLRGQTHERYLPVDIALMFKATNGGISKPVPYPNVCLVESDGQVSLKRGSMITYYAELMKFRELIITRYQQISLEYLDFRRLYPTLLEMREGDERDLPESEEEPETDEDESEDELDETQDSDRDEAETSQGKSS